MSHSSKSLQIKDPFTLLNSSKNLLQTSSLFAFSSPYFRPNAIKAPVHAPQTSPLRIPLPKQAPIFNASS
jgi:hypothetical protein